MSRSTAEAAWLSGQPPERVNNGDNNNGNIGSDNGRLSATVVTTTPEARHQKQSSSLHGPSTSTSFTVDPKDGLSRPTTAPASGAGSRARPAGGAATAARRGDGAGDGGHALRASAQKLPPSSSDETAAVARAVLKSGRGGGGRTVREAAALAQGGGDDLHADGGCGGGDGSTPAPVGTFANQSRLPILEIPTLAETLERYLAAVAPLLSKEAFLVTKGLVEEVRVFLVCGRNRERGEGERDREALPIRTTHVTTTSMC